MRVLSRSVTVAFGLLLGLVLIACDRNVRQPPPTPASVGTSEKPLPPTEAVNPDEITAIDSQIRAVRDQLDIVATAKREAAKAATEGPQLDSNRRELKTTKARLDAELQQLLARRRRILPAKEGSDKDYLSVTPSDEDLLAQSLAHLPKGNLAYSTPDKMKTGQTAHVVARIGTDKISVTTLTSGMPTDQDTATATAPSPISTKMKMTLKSADFDITQLSSEEQLVAGDTPTTWEWDISPKHSGKLRLHLAAIVVLNNLSRDFTTVDRDIAVQVDPINAAETFAKANGVWILTTLGAGLAGLWTLWRKRKNHERDVPPSWQNP